MKWNMWSNTCKITCIFWNKTSELLKVKTCYIKQHTLWSTKTAVLKQLRTIESKHASRLICHKLEVCYLGPQSSNVPWYSPFAFEVPETNKHQSFGYSWQSSDRPNLGPPSLKLRPEALKNTSIAHLMHCPHPPHLCDAWHLQCTSW